MASTPKLFDCFTFFNENDLLALRMEELDGLVETHVLVQARQTFRGKDKPDYLDYQRFQPLIDSGKLRVYEIAKFPRFITTTWGREGYQRDEIELALETLSVKDEDTIILSDIDEIPRRSAVESVNVGPNQMYRFRMNKYSYAINMLTDEGNTSAKIFSARFLRTSTPQVIREMMPTDIIENGGWEFSSLGTAEDIYTKLTSFAHDEFDHMISPEYLAQQIANGKDLLGREIGMQLVEIDETWPVAVVRDRAYWSKHELYLEGDTKCYPLDL